VDKDLAALQEVRDQLKRARDARKVMEHASQADADRWAEAVAEAGRREAVRLAKLAVEETGYGHVTGKTLKNIFATEFSWKKFKNLKTAGIIHRDEAQGVIEVAHPAGVVAAVIPTTNPTSTALFKILIAMKARCPIVVSPHPRAKACIGESCRVAAEAARAAGAPEGAVGWLTQPTLDSTQHLMGHRWTSIILATGGPGLVNAAYSSGKPAIGVGAGNTPVYVHPSADPEKAVRAIVLGQVFDNGTICSSEQSIVVERSNERAVLDAFARHGAHICSPEEIKKLEPLINRNGHMNAEIVGQFPKRLAEMAGFSVPPNTTVLLCPYTKIGKEGPLSIEKLTPLLTFYVAENQRDAMEKCLAIVSYGGLGHSCGIHATDKRVIEEYGLAMPACRINVNSPTTMGSIGYTTNLSPSMTLGCGTPGGNIFSDNIGPLHLINTKRIAFVNQEMLDEDERLEHQLRREFGDPQLPWNGEGISPGGYRSTPPVAHTGYRAPGAATPQPTPVGFGASPLTPADIEAIISRQRR